MNAHYCYAYNRETIIYYHAKLTTALPAFDIALTHIDIFISFHTACTRFIQPKPRRNSGFRARHSVFNNAAAY